MYKQIIQLFSYIYPFRFFYTLKNIFFFLDDNSRII